MAAGKHRVKVSPGARQNIVEIDGTNIADVVESLQINAERGKSRLMLNLRVAQGSKFEGDETDIIVPAATARALILLGWTPPESNVRFVPANSGQAECYQHNCGTVEDFLRGGPITGDCAACESVSPDPTEWRRLYVLAPIEADHD